MADLRARLTELAAASSRPFDANSLGRRLKSRRRRRRVAVLSGALMVTVPLATSGWFLLHDGEPTTVKVVTEPAPEVPDEQPAEVPEPAGRPTQIVATVGNRRLVVLDAATGQEIRTLYEVSEGGGLGGVSTALAPGGVQVYFEADALPTEYSCATTYRVPLAGGAVEQVADGGAAAVSPDGRFLAYATFRGGYIDVAGSCQDTVIVRNLETGEERRWEPSGAPPDDAPLELRDGRIGRISWAPDSLRLAYDVDHFPLGGPDDQSSDVRVLDTRLEGSLEEASTYVPRDGSAEGSKRSPVWLADGRIAAVFLCCDGGGVLSTNVYFVDPAQGLAPFGESPRTDPSAWAIDLDPSGQFLLYVDLSRRLHRLDPGAPGEQLATDVWHAVWVVESPGSVPAAPSTNPEPGDSAVWSIDPDAPPSPNVSTFTAQVSRLGCNNGVTGEVLRPGVVFTDTEVIVTFSVEQVTGEADCPGNELVPYDVDLGQPLGDRILVDGACLPGEAAETTSFCTEDEGVRWRPGVDTAVTIEPHQCEAVEGSDIDVASEPAWRAYADYAPWTDLNGCLVRIDVVAERSGAGHCGWETTRALIVGRPIGSRYTSPGDAREYIRDPTGVFGDPSLTNGFDPDAVLPEAAVDSGYRHGVIELWYDREDTSAIWMVFSDRIERWPEGDPPECS